jgi:hypothetical protein
VLKNEYVFWHYFPGTSITYADALDVMRAEPLGVAI